MKNPAHFWVKINSQSAKRVAGLGLMAVSLAACGGSDDAEVVVPTPTVTIAQMIASDALPASYNVAIATANAGALTIAQADNVDDEVMAALNVEAFGAALDAGTITISYSIADTAANILATGADWFDDEAVVVIDATVTLSAANFSILDSIGATFTGDVTVSDTAANILGSSADMSEAAVVVTGDVTLSVAQLEDLEDLGATFAGDVTVSDSAANILASSADMSDAAVTVTGAAVILSVEDFAFLDALNATFVAAPSVSDTLENVDGAELAGIVNLTISIASETAGGDASEAEIDATGTGTVTFDFADTDDTVTLTGSLDGFTTVAVRFGTVDLTGVVMDDSIDVITVSSGVILTAAQFLALEDGVTGGSADSTVQIAITDADDAAAVAAAIANLGGSLDASMVEFVRAEGSVLTDVAMDAFNLALDDEMDQIASANALPDALADLNAANAAVEANAEDIAEFLVDAFENEFVAAETSDQPGSASIDVEADDVVAADIGAANDAAAAVFRGVGQGTAFNLLTDAQQTAEIALERTDLQTDIDDAEVALDVAADALEFGVAELIATAELALADKVAADAAVLLAQADLPGAVGGVNGTLSSGTFASSPGAYAVGANSVLTQDQVTNVWSIAVTVTLDTLTGRYTINGGPTVRAVELDNLLVVLNDIEADEFAATAAGTVLDAAVNAATDAQDPEHAPATWTNSTGIAQQGEINYSVAAMNTYATAVGTLDAAELSLTEFEVAVDAWEATDALADELAALEATGLDLADDVTEALAAIENAVDDADAPGLGIDIITASQLGLGFDNGLAGGAPSADDLYVFDAADGRPLFVAGIPDTISTANFGADGTDRIYFGEENYTFVTLDEDIDFADSLGSASALEIFAFEDVTGVTLYVENVASAGNGTTGADFTEVTFGGLTLADMSFSSTTSILVSVENLV